MAFWPTVTVPSEQFLLWPAGISTAAAHVSSCRGYQLQALTFPRRKYFYQFVWQKRSFAVKASVDVWEDPDDGSGSDYEDEDEERKENDLDFESDWEEEQDASTARVDGVDAVIKYENDLAKEVDDLLEPEERTILHQNSASNLDKISTAKWNPLHTFALSGQIHALDQLLEDGVSIDCVDKDGLTALHVAVIGKKEAVISHLLRKGANPHAKDKVGKTPLDLSLAYGKDFKAYDLTKLLKLVPANRDL